MFSSQLAEATVVDFRLEVVSGVEEVGKGQWATESTKEVNEAVNSQPPHYKERVLDGCEVILTRTAGLDS